MSRSLRSPYYAIKTWLRTLPDGTKEVYDAIDVRPLARLRREDVHHVLWLYADAVDLLGADPEVGPLDLKKLIAEHVITHGLFSVRLREGVVADPRFCTEWADRHLRKVWPVDEG